MLTPSVATQPTPASELDRRLRGLAPGWRFAGRYRMESLVGRGGMGVVWRASDETLERPVALKFLVETLVHDPAAIDDLKRETRRALELTHHNIVRVYDFVEDPLEGLACIAMEYFPGQTLAARRIAVTARCFEPETVAPWLAQLFDAMAYAHERVGVIHRDLKPQNLMIDGRGELKVTDFGIARVASDSLTRISIGRVSGTPSYMSPQQARGEAPTMTDDIYAIGATIYELLTSRPPFWQGNIPMQLSSVTPPKITDRLRELTGIEREIPAVWEETVAACLEKEAARRPRSIREVAERLGISLVATTNLRINPAPPPMPAPSIPSDLASLQPDLELEAPTMIGATVSQETVVQEAPPPLPAYSNPPVPAIPRGLLLGGIAVALAGLAMIVGATLRHFITKQDIPVDKAAAQSATPAPTSMMTVPDQFPTIQAAIDSTPAGQTITLRPGVYHEPVTLKDGIRLVGGEGGECLLTSTAGAPAIIFVRGVRGCSLENLVLDGSEAPANGPRTDGIAISDAEVKVTRCTVRGMSGSGIVVHGTDTAADIQENHLESNAAHGALILRTGGPVVLRKNECRKNKGSGLQFDEGANGIADDNLSEENGESGIGASGVSTSPKLQNNRCNANIRNGITFAGAARGSASGNTCEQNGESGLAAVGEGTAPDFLKNTARGNTKYGIFFAGGADGEARENLCEENRMSGIGAASTSTRPELSGNQLARNQEFGIDLSNGASPRIAQDNIFTSNTAGEISR